MNRWPVVQAVLFQITWFACVLGGAAGEVIWGAGALAVMAAATLARGWLVADASLVALAAVTGFALDTLWIHTGVLRYGDAVLAPAWIVMLWIAVGLALNHCLSYFKPRPWLGGALAGASAPFSYLAGEAFGAVTIDTPLTLMAVSAAWLLVFAAAFMIAGGPVRRLEERP